MSSPAPRARRGTPHATRACPPPPRRGGGPRPATGASPPSQNAGNLAVRVRTPFVFGFFAAVGGLLAFWLGSVVLSIGSTLILVVVAAFLAAGLNPGVEWLGRHGLSRGWGVLVVILAVLAAVALFVVALVPVITDQVSAIVDNAPGWVDQLQHDRSIQ